MLSAKIKDCKYRNLFAKNETKRSIQKYMHISLLNTSKALKDKKFRSRCIYFLLQNNYFSKIKLKAKTKIVRRCILTNRNRGNFRSYGFSRFILRDYIQFGILPGYKKAVW